METIKQTDQSRFEPETKQKQEWIFTMDLLCHQACCQIKDPNMIQKFLFD